MRKLLSANFARLWKDMAFWTILLGVFILSFVIIWNGADSAKYMAERGFPRTLEDYYFNPAPYMGLAYAAFISLFLGTEHSDGTMRNKLIVGHTRTHVYLANFWVCFTACLLFMAAWFAGGAPGLILIGPFEMGAMGFFIYLLVATGFTVAFTALFTWISTVSTNKAQTVIFTLSVWMVLVFAASNIQDRLQELQMNSGAVLLNGEFVNLEPTPNPLYLDGGVRTLFECILDFLPMGQAIQMHDANIVYPLRQILFSLLFTAWALLSGIKSFHRKDLR